MIRTQKESLKILHLHFLQVCKKSRGVYKFIESILKIKSLLKTNYLNA